MSSAYLFLALYQQKEHPMDILSVISKPFIYMSIALIITAISVYFITIWFVQVVQSYKQSYKKVRRDFNLLHAIIKDIEDVSESERKIDEKANQLRYPQLKSGATIQLSDAERSWVEATEEVVRMVDNLDDTYRKLTEGKINWERICEVFKNIIKILSLPADLDSYWETVPPGICKSVERSRCIVRSLQNRPIETEQPFVYERAGTFSVDWNKLLDLSKNNPGLVSGKEKEIRYTIELPLQLLDALLRDLQELQFESETEKAWVNEAKEIMDDLDHAIDSIEETANQMKRIPYFGNVIARRQLEKSFGYINRLLWDLFYKKFLLDFTFMGRVPPKSFHPSPQQQTQDTTVDQNNLELLDNFLKHLNWEPSFEAADSFKVVRRFLLKAKGAIEGMDYSSKVWKDHMNIIFEDANSLLPSQSQRSNRSSTRNETHPSRKFSAENAPLVKALRLLAISIRVCRIELRKETNSVVGLEEDVDKLVVRLTTNNCENFSTLSIVGMEGIGKTTLAKVVFSHKVIKKHFEEKYWVDLPDHMVDQKSLLTALSKVVLPNHKEKKKDYSLTKEVNDLLKVKDLLKAKKYLLVLDNISNKETWDNLIEAFIEAFRNSKNGSRILLTTRDKSVALHVGGPSCCPLYLRLRTKEESLDLFKQMVSIEPEPSRSDQRSSESEKAKEVVIKCGGLPLSILSPRYLLSGKDVKIKDLTRMLEHVKFYQTPWTENLERQLKDLPENQSKCLSYFGRFPKDSEISVRRLSVLWVAEGFVKQSCDKQKSLKSVAEEYLNEFIDRNLVQTVARNPNGNVKTCVFPGALRDLWFDKNPIMDRDVFCYVAENDASSSHALVGNRNSPNIWQNCRNPSTILCFDSRVGDKPGKEIGEFLRKGIANEHFRQLNVLDLEQVFRPQFPKNFGKLIQLKHLGLRWTYLEEIPSSIGDLVNLETLDVKHTYIHTLPSSIWKLQKLQYLFMSDIFRSKIKHPKEQYHQQSQFLESLEILRGAFVDKDSHLKDALKRMNKLKIMDLAFQLDWSQQKELAESLVELKVLQELTLKSIDEMGRPQDLHVNQFACLENLSALYLFGKLNNPSIITGLPLCLTELTLSFSELSYDPMPELGKLDKLESLCFYSNSYTGKRMNCSKGGFPKLKVLKLWMLPKLEEWNVEEKAMLSLKHLEIRSCKKLKVPTITSMRHLESLREVKLKDMSVDFKNEIELNKDEIWKDVALRLVITYTTQQ